jgi:hypothetical protein
MDPASTIKAFDTFLAARHLRLDAIVVGGAALNLLGVVARTTRDCDILWPTLPPAIADAARAFAAERRLAGEVLADDWLNNGPADLASALPTGWDERLITAFQGKAIVLRSLGRLDLLRSKLFALCDRGIDLSDCLALVPTDDELEQVAPWLEEQDLNPDWRAHTRANIDDIRRRLGRGV